MPSSAVQADSGSKGEGQMKKGIELKYAKMLLYIEDIEYNGFCNLTPMCINHCILSSVKIFVVSLHYILTLIELPKSIDRCLPHNIPIS